MTPTPLVHPSLSWLSVRLGQTGSEHFPMTNANWACNWNSMGWAGLPSSRFSSSGHDPRLAKKFTVWICGPFGIDYKAIGLWRTSRLMAHLESRLSHRRLQLTWYFHNDSILGNMAMRSIAAFPLVGKRLERVGLGCEEQLIPQDSSAVMTIRYGDSFRGRRCVHCRLVYPFSIGLFSCRLDDLN